MKISMNEILKRARENPKAFLRNACHHISPYLEENKSSRCLKCRDNPARHGIKRPCTDCGKVYRAASKIFERYERLFVYDNFWEDPDNFVATEGGITVYSETRGEYESTTHCYALLKNGKVIMTLEDGVRIDI